MENITFKIKISRLGNVGRYQQHIFEIDSGSADKICLAQARKAAANSLKEHNRSETFEVTLTSRVARIQLPDYSSYGEGITWDVIEIHPIEAEKYTEIEMRKLKAISQAATAEARGRTSDDYVQKSGYWSND